MDNEPEYVYSYNSEFKYHPSEYTKALNKKEVVHQTIPIRSPQSNGKIRLLAIPGYLCLKIN